MTIDTLTGRKTPMRLNDQVGLDSGYTFQSINILSKTSQKHLFVL
jgi:hypothetical protein